MSNRWDWARASNKTVTERHGVAGHDQGEAAPATGEGREGDSADRRAAVQGRGHTEAEGEVMATKKHDWKRCPCLLCIYWRTWWCA